MPQDLSFNFSPVLPLSAIALLAAALCLLLVLGSMLLRRKQVPVRWVATLAVLRSLIVIVLVLCLIQPMISYSRSAEQRPDLLVMVDTSQSMGMKAAGDDQTRLDTTIHSLRRGGMLASLGEHFNVHWFAFDRDARPIEESDITHLRTDGDSTRLADSLSTAVANRQSGDAVTGTVPSAHVLLVSDGDDLGNGDVVETARRLGVTVDTLAPEVVDAPSAAGNIVISNVQNPPRVLLGSEVQIAASLHAETRTPGPQQLSLVDAGETLATRQITFQPGQTEQTIRFSHRPTQVGLRKYELRLSNGPASMPYAFSIAVVDAKNQVLVLEDNWRWELKFLRRVIEDDPSFSFTALLSRNGGGGMHVQLAEADHKTTLAGFPQGASDLSWFDTIVLGDVNPRRWPPALAAGIAHAVKEDGKGLVIIAGPNLAGVAEIPELNALLPVEITRESSQPVEGPVEVRPSTEGADSEFFLNIRGDGLPPLDRVYPPLRKRPGASILLEAASRANAYGKLIVLAEQTVGRGRVLFISTDSLWNWQTAGTLDSQGVTPYALFWQQAMRALAPLHTRTGDVTLELNADRSRYEVGQRIVLRARYRSTGPLASPALRAVVTLPDQRQVALSFEPDSQTPNGYRAELDAMLPGQYRFQGGVGSRGKPVEAEALTAIDVQPPRSEASSTHIDRANLARIADATGGKSVRPSDPSTWPTAGKVARTSIREVRHVNLWSNLSLLTVLCVLLGIDWLMRLVRGYV